MSQSKHTPGPWRAVDRYTVLDNTGRPETEEQVGIPPNHITRVTVGRNYEEAEANARLIAAAPEMLEALEAVDADEPGAWRKVRAALARAKGGDD